MGNIQRPALYFDTWQYVYERASAKPYVGFEHLEDLPQGFRFDLKRWCSPFDLKLPTLPRLANPSTQQINESYYFKSGVGDEYIDLIVNFLTETYQNHERLWLPHVRHGSYYRYKIDYFYYGDNSIVQYVDPQNNIDDRNCVTLNRERLVGSPVLAASFKREPVSRAIVYDRRITQVPVFSGVYVDGIEQSTYTPITQSIVWNSVDATKREFVLDTHTADIAKLCFNKDYVRHVGVDPQTLHDFGACDVLGQSDATEFQSFHLERFPVLPQTFKLYVVDAQNGTWEEWTRVETYHELLSLTVESLVDPYIYGGKFYYLDRDLGQIFFGNATSGIPETNRWIIAQYDITLRIEYEEANHPTDSLAWEANVNPVTQAVNQGFVLISHEPLEAANITLDINKEKAMGSVDAYGPVFVGNDWAELMATVTSAMGTPVPNVEIQFHMTPLLGHLGGSMLGTSFGFSNPLGQAFTYYQPPLDASNIGYYATNPEGLSDNWLQLDTQSTGLSLDADDDIYLFQVLKDDPLLGMHDGYIEDHLPSPPPWANPNTNPPGYEQWKEDMIIQLNLEKWQINTTTGRPNGRKVVVYQFDPEATNPITGASGAFGPVRPLEITNNGSRLRYPADSLLPFDPVNMSPDIGAYWVVGSFYVSFWASCWSPYYNKTITSNEIRIKIILPRHLVGEHINNTLNKLPLGWKVLTDFEYNHAAGLDGATFLTVNPAPGPYEIINWFGEPTPEQAEWVQSIMSTKAFKIKNLGS